MQKFAIHSSANRSIKTESDDQCGGFVSVRDIFFELIEVDAIYDFQFVSVGIMFERDQIQKHMLK